MMKKLCLATIFLTRLACAQGVRYDVPPILGPTGQPLPNIAVTLCSGNATITGATCAPQTISYSDITLGVPCTLGNPVTLTVSTQCQNTSDAFGNAGFWLSPGAYVFCLTGRGIAGNCYNLTLPAGVTPLGIARLGSPVQIGGADTGLSRTAAGTITVGNGTQGDATGTLNGDHVLMQSSASGVFASRFYGTSGTTGGFSAGNGVLGVSAVERFAVYGDGSVRTQNLGFSSITGGTINAPDTSISRAAAGILAVGNGTQGDASGTVKASVAQLGDGSVSAPSHSFLNETGTGLFRLGPQNLGFTFGGVGAFQFFSAGIANAPASVYSWVSSFNGPRDTGFSRLSAGVIGVGNGLQGDTTGTLKATTVNAVSGFQVNGTALAAGNLSNGVTGSGAVVLASSPTIVAAILTGPFLSSPTVNPGGIALSGSTSGSTVVQPQVVASGTLSLPAATDTLVARATTDTLTNKRITQRVVSLADGTSFTMTSDTADMNTQVNTQAAGTLTANAPTGSPTDGQKLMLRIKSTNVQNFSWNAIFRGSTTSPLPTSSTGTVGVPRTDYIGFIFNAADSKWDCIAVDMGH